MPEVLTFKIEDFEGPLDLLLYLVGKNKMNLYDVNIMELIEQYTAAIREMQQDRMEISSEFIDMAAHLVQMKSALLLPRSPEAERMKAELTGRLIEYSACKEVAAQLGSRARDLYTAAREPMPLVGAAEYTRRHDPNWLVQAWFNLMGRSTRKATQTQEKFEPLVIAPFVYVASRVSHMLRGLLKGRLQQMGELFSREESRSTNVATFLALLELIRAEALTRGYHIITCPCAMHPEDKIDHILIPELKLAFLTDNRWHPVHLPSVQAVRCTRFLDRENLAAYRARLRFNERAAAELLEQASALMAQAKSCHDELETYYRAAVDFGKVDEAAAECMEMFGLK